MANIGKYFLQGFQPNFANNFNTSYRYGLAKDEEEKRKQAELQAQLDQQRQQQSILAQITRSSINPPQLVNGKYESQGVSYPNASSLGLLSQLSDHNYRIAQDWQKQNTKERKPYTNINYGESIQAFDPNTNSIVNLGKNQNFKPKQESTWIGDLPSGDKIKKLKGYENPNADPKSETTYVKDGKKYTITDYTTWDKFEKKSGDGEDYWDISPETKKMFKDYYKEQQTLRAITNAQFGNAPSKKTDSEGNPITIAQELDRHNKIYLSAVQDVMRPEAKKWYDGLYNATNGNLDPRDYLLSLKSAFTKGKLGSDPNKSDNYDVADFNTLLEQFKAIYGYDAREQYGKFLEDIK